MKPVILTSRALKDLQRIKSFIKYNYGDEKVEETINILFHRMRILESLGGDFINIGAIDDDFSHLKFTYRKLFEGHYKITYREGAEKIYVVRIFDTRQHPDKNK